MPSSWLFAPKCIRYVYRGSREHSYNTGASYLAHHLNGKDPCPRLHLCPSEWQLPSLSRCSLTPVQSRAVCRPWVWCLRDCPEAGRV